MKFPEINFEVVVMLLWLLALVVGHVLKADGDISGATYVSASMAMCFSAMACVLICRRTGAKKMITNEIEKFTAEMAISDGLGAAVKRGTVKIEGYYTVTPEGFELEQKQFVFIDKYGGLRVGVFESGEELIKFGEYLGAGE